MLTLTSQISLAVGHLLSVKHGGVIIELHSQVPPRGALSEPIPPLDYIVPCW